jgi:hypothetical protein
MPSVPGVTLRSLSIAAVLLLPAAPAGAFCFSIACSPNITISTGPNLCSAVVNYSAPIPIFVPPGDCGTIACTPASGSAFPVGTTPVTCNSSEGESCGFDITVFDTQPPQITVPENLTIVGTNPGVPLVVNYMAPQASDNCPAVVYNCDPPAGSEFPIGDSTVTCTATDASGNTATGSFALEYFDACVQDDASGEFVRWRTSDGLYEFFSCADSACGAGGFRRPGVGESTATGGGFALRHRQDDRSVAASVHVAKEKGKASLKFRTGSTRLSSKLKDAQIFDDVCTCQ